MRSNTSPIRVMASAQPTRSVAAFDDTTSIPSRFFGWHYTTWTVASLQQIAGVLNVDAPAGLQKRDLYQLIVDLKPEHSSFSPAEVTAIQAIKDARSISKAAARRSWANIATFATTTASRKRPSSARYRVTSKRRRSTSDSDELSSDSEYIDSDYGDARDIAVLSSPVTASGGPANSSWSLPCLRVTRLNDHVTLRDGAESSGSNPPAGLSTPADTVSCEVCLEVLSSKNRLARRPTSNCLHGHNFICRSCFEKHITVSSTSLSWEMIPCPHDSCRAVLSFNDMQSFAAPEIFARYDEYINKRGLETLSDYVPCANVQCHSGGIVDPAVNSFATCGTCGTQTCIDCRTRYHPGTTHVENLAALKEAENDNERARKRTEEDAASQAFIDKKTKTCSNEVCGIKIQKISGCNHMTCAQCRHEFCWICLADYKAIRRHGNARHATTCRLHSSRLK